MMKRKTFFVLLALLPAMAFAQEETTKTEVADEPHNQVSLTGGLNSNDAWELELSYQRKLASWLDVGMGVGFFKQWNDDAELGWEHMEHERWTGWKLDDDYKKVSNLYARPFVQLSTPALFRVADCKFHLYAQPGLILTIPHDKVNVTLFDGSTGTDGVPASYSTSEGRWLNWSLRVAIEARGDDFSLSLGYGMSNLDIYTFRRNISFHSVSFKDYYGSKHYTGSFFLTIGYRF